MSVNQGLIFTVLPFGQIVGNADHPSYLTFSVVVSPRLQASDPAARTLGKYTDWSPASTAAGAAGRTWPETIAALASSFRLSLADLPGAPSFPATLVGAVPPDPVRFAAVFPPSTPVTPYAYKGFEGRKIRSAPVGSVVDHLASLYGQFGLASPTSYPPYASLVPADAFGAMGFEQDNTVIRGVPPDPGIPGNGPQRKGILQNALETQLTKDGALPYDLSSLAATLPSVPGAETSLAFLQHQMFLQRGLPDTSGPIPRPAPPVFDFHQMVASLASLPTLMRALGLVLDLRAGPLDPRTIAAWKSGATSRATLVAATTGFTTTTELVLPSTQSLFSPGVFRPAPKDPSTTELSDRQLKLGDPGLYRVVRVDHDNAVARTMQFANSITRSRIGGRKRTLTTPDGYALPALRTGGFAIARSGRAQRMAADLDRQTAELQAGFFGPGTPPRLYEDDLVRGYRFDVLHQRDGVWRSLMWRQGTIAVNGTDPLTVLEEDTVVPSPTTQGAGSTDLYLQETLTRWDGWSLAVPRQGQPFVDGGPTSGDPGSTGFNITTSWAVPGASASGGPTTSTGNHRRLPRLRFGELYQLRARAADLAGNSVPVETAPAATAVTPESRHLRFEPVAAPRVLFVDPPLPGASEEVVVVRSESATVDGTVALDNVATTRLVVPSPTSVTMAEQHKAFDVVSKPGEPMNQVAKLYQDLAQRDATDLTAAGELVDPGRPHGTDNPYLYPGYLPIDYLPEYIGRSALVRNLWINAFKQTVATLPFDTAGAGWPTLQGARIVLSRGTGNDWAVKTVTDPDDAAVVTTELDLTLGKGYMFTTLVNAAIDQPTLDLMALWEWLQRSPTATSQNIAAARSAILAGKHWMVTPWRQVTFVHAVRTPLLAPRLHLQPTKGAIGQTRATFTGTSTLPNGGTAEFSRRSTARVDVDAAWAMPVDTGSNADPVTPQQFTGHAFTLEPTRSGYGYLQGANGVQVTTADAENFVRSHEFGDTKFRAVTYRGTATSYYVEYFREQLVLPLGADPVAALRAAAVAPGVAFEGSTVQVTLTWTDASGARTRRLVPALPGTRLDAPAPTPGDYLVTEDPLVATDPAHATHGTVQVLANAAVSSAGLTGASVRFSYVAPTIHTHSDPVADGTTSASMHVLNSARPTAPDVRYVVPIYQTVNSGATLTRTGGALRVYLERPWWSSGDQERLGVVCWHRTNSDLLPPTDLASYVTLWGYDPVFSSTTAINEQPTPAYFPLAVSSSSTGSLSVAEATEKVDVAGHKVGFDAVRGLWYADIKLAGPRGLELTTYTPFIRLALARYQPNSIADAHLSKVHVVDYAQLAPNRSVTLTGRTTRSIQCTVTGRAPVASAASGAPSRMRVIIEQRHSRIADDALAWSPATGPSGFSNTLELTPTVAGSDLVTWKGTVLFPTGNTAPLRLTFEEFERIKGGAGVGRLAFTATMPLSTF